MDSINKILKHLTGAIHKALNENLNLSLNRKLNASLRYALAKKENGDLICDELGVICHDVVYFVLNATDIRNDKRTFHVGINWANLNDEVRKNQLVVSTPVKDDLLSNESASGVVPFSTIRNFSPSEEEINRLTLSWNIVWQEYYELTKEYEKESPVFLTINHWLLYYLNCPLNLGIYWGSEKNDENADRNYVRLLNNTLKGMNITLPTAGMNGAHFIKLPLKFKGQFIDNGDLSQILAMLEEMEQIDPKLKLNSIPNVAFSIYHLIRSYGCWGGNAFYSIPINYGRYDKPVRGLLSLCTTKPMNSELALKWYIIANKIFKDVILNDIEEMKDFENELNSLRDISMSTHAIKTMVNGLLNPPLSSLKQDPSFEQNLQLDVAIQAKRKIIGLAEIINLISKLSANNNCESIAEKDLEKSGLFSHISEKVSFSKILEGIQETRKLDKNLTEIVFNYKVHFELPDDFLQYRNVKLNSLFFEIYLLTAMENCVEHGIVNRDGKCYVNMLFDSSEKSLVITNQAKYRTMEEVKMRGNFRLFQIILGNLKIGRFTPTQEIINDKLHFQIILKSF